MPGKKIRKSKDSEAGTKLTYWRNQKVREADAGGTQLEAGEVVGVRFLRIVGPVREFEFHCLGILSPKPQRGALNRQTSPSWEVSKSGKRRKYG